MEQEKGSWRRMTPPAKEMELALVFREGVGGSEERLLVRI
jgi:hypothetical protein